MADQPGRQLQIEDQRRIGEELRRLLQLLVQRGIEGFIGQRIFGSQGDSGEEPAPDLEGLDRCGASVALGCVV